jgi:micrococcal nuclease
MIRIFQKRRPILFISLLTLFIFNASHSLAGQYKVSRVTVKSYGPDRYGRTLGEVFVDGKIVNLEMVKAGLAEVYRGTPAKGQNMKPYRKAEEEAKAAKRGMWVLGDKYVSPREWRKTHAN